MRSISNFLEKTIRILVGILLIVLSANVFFQILSRQVLKIPTVWTEEVARFSFIWLTMLGASLQVKYKSHYAVDLLQGVMKNTYLIKGMNLFAYILMLLLALSFLRFGIDYSLMGLNRYSTSANIRMIWIYSAIPVGGLLMSFFLIELIVKEFGNNQTSTAKVGE